MCGFLGPETHLGDASQILSCGGMWKGGKSDSELWRNVERWCVEKIPGSHAEDGLGVQTRVEAGSPE